MNNWKVIFATVVIFGAGVITGGLLVNYVQHPYKKPQRAKSAGSAEARPQNGNQSVRAADPAKLRPPEILSKRFLQQLDASLHLRPDQREAIQKIIGEGQNMIRKSIEDARLEIREILTAEQQREFDHLVKRPFHKPIFGTNAPPGLPSGSGSGAATNTAI